MFKDKSNLKLASLIKVNPEADSSCLDIHAGSKCVLLADPQHSPSLAPDKRLKHADRFPILPVCQTVFLDMRTALKWQSVLRNDKRKDSFLLFFPPYFIPA